MRDRTHKPLAALGMTAEDRKRAEQAAARSRSGRELVDNGDGELVPRPKSRSGEEDAKPEPDELPKGKESVNWVLCKDTDILDLIHTLDNSKSRALLTDWERKFYDSIKEFVDQKGGLTTRQYEKLADVVDRVEARSGR